MKKFNWRFWEKVVGVEFSGACWVWKGAKNGDGYGMFQMGGYSEKAHRAMWQMVNGKIPRGKHVLHRCDNPPCVNPKHLFLGSNADNVADKVTKNRQAKGDTLRKYSLASVLEALTVYDRGVKSVRRLERERLWGRGTLTYYIKLRKSGKL